MQGKFVDIHTHILPSIDDGPKTIEQSVKMVKQAVQQGVGAIIATPHYIPDEIEYEKEIVLEKVANLQKAIDAEGIECNIYPGMELYLSPQLIERIDKGKVIPIGGKGKYLLVEFPGVKMSESLISLLHEIRIRGYKAVIAHPERNRALMEEPNLVNELLQQNALLQINACSIIGQNGDRAQKVAHNFLRQGLVSFIASDAHSDDRRVIELEKAFQVAKKVLRDDPSSLFTMGQAIIELREIPPAANRFGETNKGIFGNLRSLFS